ncbi:MAG: hypothetical protein CMH27_10445 [Micavibrio sp.]|nr:hypothetical protein [Micavibrio sp.]|tara:strand:- start:475 stop:666 length:192 start_codon:yes stop_codon:yes gene_type:complete
MKKQTHYFILIGIISLALGVGAGFLIKNKITANEMDNKVANEKANETSVSPPALAQSKQDQQN